MMTAVDGNSNEVADNACPRRWCFQRGKLSLMPPHGMDDDHSTEISSSSDCKKRSTASIEWHPDHYVAIRKKDSGVAAAVGEVLSTNVANAADGGISKTISDDPTEVVSIYFFYYRALTSLLLVLVSVLPRER